MLNRLVNIYEENRGFAHKINELIIGKLDSQDVREELIENIPLISIYMKINDMESYKNLLEEMLKYDDIRDGIKCKWCIIMNNCDNGIKLIEPFAKYPEIKEDMRRKVESIISYSNWNSFKDLVHGISYIDDDNASIITKYLDENFIDDAILYGEEVKLAGEIVRYKGLKQKDKHIKNILQSTKRNIDIVEIIYGCKGTEANLVYEEHKGIMKLYEATLKNPNYATIEVADEIIGDIIRKGIEDEVNALVEICGGKDPKIVSDGAGRHSATYNINGKHLKLEKGMNNFKIPKNHRRFLQPYIRKQRSGICIEVYDEQDNNHDNITDEEVLMVFEELYKDGLVWADAKKENLVRLLKDNNLPHFVIERDDTVYGFEEHTEQIEVLKKGEVAICDLDYIYSIDDPEYKSGNYARGWQSPEIIALEKKLKKERNMKNEGR